ncbi:transcriptional regulator swi6 [Entophlyctis sp. JEL0112]|nr:transcriptional regulator swi6 [Entophlyctis sp. JEL0112]
MHVGPTGPSPAATVSFSLKTGIPVYVMLHNSVQVMRRADDGWVNATQILTAAGLARSAQLSALADSGLLQASHRRVDEGFRGLGLAKCTWVSVTDGIKLAEKFNLGVYLKPLFDIPFDTEQPNPTSRIECSPSTANVTYSEDLRTIDLGNSLLYCRFICDTRICIQSINGIEVMRRIDDGWMNVKQILRIALLNEGRKSKKIIRKKVYLGIRHGPHEIVDTTGEPHFRGIWVPPDIALGLAQNFQIDKALKLLFDQDIQSDSPTDNLLVHADLPERGGPDFTAEILRTISTSELSCQSISQFQRSCAVIKAIVKGAFFEVSWPFLWPMTSTSKLENPMDFGTIQKQINSGIYSSIEALERDARLVFSNCYVFYDPSHQIYAKGKKLEKIFNTLWEASINFNCSAASILAEPTGVSAKVQRESSARCKRVRSASSYLPNSKKRSTHDEIRISLISKEELVERVEQLRPEFLEYIYLILSWGDPELDDIAAGCDAVEIDLEKLDHQTYVDISEFVSGCLSNPQGSENSLS